MIKVDPESVKANFHANALASIEAGTTTMERALGDAARLRLFLDLSERLSDGRVDFEPWVRQEMARRAVSADEIETFVAEGRAESRRERW